MFIKFEDILRDEVINNRYIENIEKDNFYKKYDCVVMSAYMNSKLDPQRNIKIDGSDFNYIKDWYFSVKKHKLHAIVFHDHLSDNFIKKYSTDRILFRKVRMGKQSINDERFIIWYRYLLYNPYKYILTTDISDVVINTDPFSYVKNNGDNKKIFIGTNTTHAGEPKIRNKHWFDKREHKLTQFNSFKSKIYPIRYEFHTYQLYNPGLLSGYLIPILMILSEVNKIHLEMKKPNNFNMITFNYLIHTFLMEGNNKDNYNTNYIISGEPFNSRYKMFNNELNNYLIHK